MYTYNGTEYGIPKKRLTFTFGPKLSARERLPYQQRTRQPFFGDIISRTIICIHQPTV